MATSAAGKTIIVAGTVELRRALITSSTDNTAFAAPFMGPVQNILAPGSYDLTKILGTHSGTGATSGVNDFGAHQHTSVNGQHCVIIPRGTATMLHVFPFANSGGTGQVYIGRAARGIKTNQTADSLKSDSLKRLVVPQGFICNFTASTAIQGVASNEVLATGEFLADVVTPVAPGGVFPNVDFAQFNPVTANGAPAQLSIDLRGFDYAIIGLRRVGATSVNALWALE